MKKIALIAAILFLLFTFAGSVYVIINHGHVNAGYAVIPAVWAIICLTFYRNYNK